MFKNNVVKIFVFLFSLLFIIGLSCGVLVFKYIIGAKPPTDAILLANFREKKSKYEELLLQFTADRSSDPTDGRIFYYEKADRNNATYKGRLADLDVIEITKSVSSGVAFVQSQTVLNGSKGIVHITDPDFKKVRAFYIVSSTDNSSQLPNDHDSTSDTYYVPIGDNWYIFYSEFGD